MTEKEWFPAVLRENCTGPFTYPLFFKDSRYAKEKEKMSNRPELKVGDVFRDIQGRWIMVVTEDEGYSLRSDMGSMLQAQCTLSNYTPVEIYRPTHAGRIFTVQTLVDIVNGRRKPYWSAKRTPVEMTVDEVSDKLGYAVKIVGEKR